ncbi:MAG: helix-turn-helix domain-containing protein, partial [Methylovirgula sp.]
MEELGTTIRRARKKMGRSQAELAKRAGVRQQAVARIESGKTKHSRATPPILAALGLDERLVSPAQPSTAAGPEEIPIIGLADPDEGGLSEMRAPFVGSVPRQQRLTGVPGIYAAYMRGSSMAPMYRSGDLLVIDPHQAPRLEDGALFVSKDRNKVRIAEYAGETAKEWICKHWGDNPAEFTLKKSEFPYCECVYSVCKR